MQSRCSCWCASNGYFYVVWVWAQQLCCFSCSLLLVVSRVIFEHFKHKCFDSWKVTATQGKLRRCVAERVRESRRAQKNTRTGRCFINGCTLRTDKARSRFHWRSAYHSSSFCFSRPLSLWRFSDCPRPIYNELRRAILFRGVVASGSLNNILLFTSICYDSFHSFFSIYSKANIVIRTHIFLNL